MKNPFILFTIPFLFLAFQNLHSQSDVRNNILTHIEKKIILSQENVDSALELFAKHASYDNKTIRIVIGNPSGKKSVYLKGLARVSEISTPEEFERHVDLSGTAEELIEIEVDGIYDINLELRDKVDAHSIMDKIYIADGAWSIDNYQAAAVLQKFEISEDGDRDFNEDSYLIERNVSLKGRIKNDFAITKNISIGGSPMDFSSFAVFDFNARGSATVQVVLVNKEIEFWEDQLQTTITLGEDLEGFRLKKEDFGKNQVNWKAINKIVFVVKGSGYNYANLDFEISELRFKKERQVLPTSNKLHTVNIFPNPITTSANLNFESTQEMTYEFQLWSVDGKLVHRQNGIALKGVNEVFITRKGIEAGNYFSRLITEDGTVRLSRIAIL